MSGKSGPKPSKARNVQGYDLPDYEGPASAVGYQPMPQSYAPGNAPAWAQGAFAMPWWGSTPNAPAGPAPAMSPGYNPVTDTMMQPRQPMQNPYQPPPGPGPGGNPFQPPGMPAGIPPEIAAWLTRMGGTTGIEPWMNMPAG